MIVFTFVKAVLVLLQLAMLGRVLYSWVDQTPYPNNRVKEVLWSVTDPILTPLRRYVPPMGMFDITPMVAMLILWALQEVLQVLECAYSGLC